MRFVNFYLMYLPSYIHSKLKLNLITRLLYNLILTNITIAIKNDKIGGKIDCKNSKIIEKSKITKAKDFKTIITLFNSIWY